ncbi:MAG: zinc ribbon domain-containing protein, partial [Planctomycetes bacterium]|nr:zinc ribbon domain-containing protein [Planctomycetota bacterium]
LLDEKTIKAIQQRTQANKTYLHGNPKHKYLFGGMVFCGHCGYSMFGQTNHNGHSYYRHAHTKRDHQCECKPRPWVRAEELESAVIEILFDTFGNKAAVQRAIDDATPNRDKVEAARQKMASIKAQIKKVQTGRQKILDLIADGDLSEEDAKSKLAELKDRESKFQDELDRVNANLDGVPNREAIEAVANELDKKYGSARLAARKRIANRDLKGMSWDDKRALAEKVFNGTNADGNPSGIYIQQLDSQKDRRRKNWKFILFGVTPINEKKAVTHDASCSPGKALLEWR